MFNRIISSIYIICTALTINLSLCPPIRNIDINPVQFLREFFKPENEELIYDMRSLEYNQEYNAAPQIRAMLEDPNLQTECVEDRAIEQMIPRLTPLNENASHLLFPGPAILSIAAFAGVDSEGRKRINFEKLYNIMHAIFSCNQFPSHGNVSKENPYGPLSALAYIYLSVHILQQWELYCRVMPRLLDVQQKVIDFKNQYERDKFWNRQCAQPLCSDIQRYVILQRDSSLNNGLVQGLYPEYTGCVNLMQGSKRGYHTIAGTFGIYTLQLSEVLKNIPDTATTSSSSDHLSAAAASNENTFFI